MLVAPSIDLFLRHTILEVPLSEMPYLEARPSFQFDSRRAGKSCSENGLPVVFHAYYVPIPCRGDVKTFVELSFGGISVVGILPN